MLSPGTLECACSARHRAQSDHHCSRTRSHAGHPPPPGLRLGVARRALRRRAEHRCAHASCASLTCSASTRSRHPHRPAPLLPEGWVVIGTCGCVRFWRTGGVPKGSLKRAWKRHFLARSANDYQASRSRIHCKQQDETKTHDHTYCQRCESVWGKEVCPQRQDRHSRYLENSSNAKRRDRVLRLRKPPNKVENAESFTSRFLNLIGAVTT